MLNVTLADNLATALSGDNNVINQQDVTNSLVTFAKSLYKFSNAKIFTAEFLCSYPSTFQTRHIYICKSATSAYLVNFMYTLA